jgi:hypothetical protein
VPPPPGAHPFRDSSSWPRVRWCWSGHGFVHGVLLVGEVVGPFVLIGIPSKKSSFAANASAVQQEHQDAHTFHVKNPTLKDLTTLKTLSAHRAMGTTTALLLLSTTDSTVRSIHSKCIFYRGLLPDLLLACWVHLLEPRWGVWLF